MTKTFKRKKSLTRQSRKKPKESKEPAKTAARRDVFSTTSKVMEELKETEINEFEKETHQVAFDSDFSD